MLAFILQKSLNELQKFIKTYVSELDLRSEKATI